MNQLESVFWGIIAGLAAIFIELIVFVGYSLATDSSSDISLLKFFSIPAFVIAGVFIEEICKYAVIATRIDLLSLKWSYFLNSLLAGLGFFAVELGLILQAGTLPAYSLIGELALVHMGTCALMGYVVTFRNPKKISTFLLAIFPALVFHGSYNILSLGRNSITDYAVESLLAVLLFFVFLSALDIKRKLAQE